VTSQREYLGYNFASSVAGNFIPQRLQNLCIRDYARTKGLLVSFSASEYADAGRALMLFTQFESMDRLAGLVFYSIQLLPADRARRLEFYARIRALGKEVHFALEDLLFDGATQDHATIERIYQISMDGRLPGTSQRLIELGLHGPKNRD
jgi:sporadic carbohydrate cluster protein (TIGR04323 family)